MFLFSNAKDLEKMKSACRIAANVLKKLSLELAPGITTYDLNELAKQFISDYGAQSACYQYSVGNRKYPGHVCISINEEVVHGIPSRDKVIKSGDVVSLDVCIIYEGFVGDNAITLPVGSVASDIYYLLDITKKSLFMGIDQAINGNRVGNISYAIQSYVEHAGLQVVKDFVGHGVGRSMHEEPQIPNFGKPNTGPSLYTGMALAIEPMVNMEKSQVRCLKDQWTIVAVDQKPSAHFEHTVLVTQNEPQILTLPDI